MTDVKQKKKFRACELVRNQSTIDIDDDTEMTVRALSLTEMVNLLAVYGGGFINLYMASVGQGDAGEVNFAPMILSSPRLIANIIALASDTVEEEDAVTNIQKHMNPLVQLIALKEIWKLSVPDPKKLAELLSGVMALLKERGLRLEEGKKTPETVSQMPSSPESNSSVPTDTVMQT